MANNDYHIIKPVESLQNTAGLAGVKRREERKRRRNLPGQHKQERGSTKGGQDNSRENSKFPPPAEPEADRHSVDYCA